LRWENNEKQRTLWAAYRIGCRSLDGGCKSQARLRLRGPPPLPVPPPHTHLCPNNPSKPWRLQVGGVAEAAFGQGSLHSIPNVFVGWGGVSELEVGATRLRGVVRESRSRGF
jgi:hypothetical protein